MIFSPLFPLRRRARLAVRSSAVVAALFALALGTTAFAADAATASIAPFINKDTLGVARVNFENVDFDKLAETLDGVVANALKDFGYDAASIEKVGAELDKTFAALAQEGKTQLDASLKTLLPTEIFVVVQSAEGEGFAILVPVEKASETQRDALTATAKLLGQNGGFDAAVYQDRFLVVAQDLKAFGRYYRNFKSGDNKKIDAFFKKNASAFAAGYCGTIRLRPFLDVAFNGETQVFLAEQPRPLRDALEVFDSTFVDASYVVDAGTFSDRLTLRFSAPVDAGRFLTAIQGAVDEFSKIVFNPNANPIGDLVSDETAREFNLVPLARELWRGQIRSQLPKQNGAELFLERNLSKEAAKATGNAAIVAVAAALYQAANQARYRAPSLEEPVDGEIDFGFDEAETPVEETTDAAK